MQTPGLPRLPEMPSSYDDHFSDLEAPPRDPVHVHVHVNQREIGDALVNFLDDELARR